MASFGGELFDRAQMDDQSAAELGYDIRYWKYTIQRP